MLIVFNLSWSIWSKDPLISQPRPTWTCMATNTHLATQEGFAICDVSLFVKKQNDSLVSHEDISNKIIQQFDGISSWSRMYQLFIARSFQNQRIPKAVYRLFVKFCTNLDTPGHARLRPYKHEISIPSFCTCLSPCKKSVFKIVHQLIQEMWRIKKPCNLIDREHFCLWLENSGFYQVWKLRRFTASPNNFSSGLFQGKSMIQLFKKKKKKPYLSLLGTSSAKLS